LIGLEWTHYGLDSKAKNASPEAGKQLVFNKMTTGEYSPEKAGVGGSIPSLATIISIT
jgi:hypothetical protein